MKHAIAAILIVLSFVQMWRTEEENADLRVQVGVLAEENDGLIRRAIIDMQRIDRLTRRVDDLQRKLEPDEHRCPGGNAE